ncbi:MAG: ribose 5-phosphate isomerase B [Bacteroidales bacterium]|nr:ribose 5-phosphate isomerase B [Bacteroidales bacterium]
MKIPIASDHAGYSLKSYLINHLEGTGIEFEDFGTHSEESVDYPDFIHPVAKAVDEGIYEKAVIICGSGQGAAMTANKYPGVRAALCWDTEQAKMTRLHNNANIIALPGRYINFETALEAVKIFVYTGFEGGRHLNRVNRISVRL